MSDDHFTPEQLAQPDEYGGLAPEYFAARDTAQRYMEHFKPEMLEPLVEQITDRIRERVWDDFRSWLISDTESNIACNIENLAVRIVHQLLEGDESAIERHVFRPGWSGEQVRKSLAEHLGDELAKARIADLESTIESIRRF